MITNENYLAILTLLEFVSLEIHSSENAVVLGLSTTDTSSLVEFNGSKKNELVNRFFLII